MKWTQRNLLVGGLVLAALLVGSWVTSLFPDPLEVVRAPHVVAGTVGENVSMRGAEVKVIEAVAAKEIVSRGNAIATSGAFVLVTYHYVTTHESQEPSPGAIQDAAGRTFGGRQAVRNSCGTAQPGLWRLCQAAIEVDEKALAGDLTFRLGAGTSWRADDVLSVPLGTLPAPTRSVTLSEGRWLTAEEQR